MKILYYCQHVLGMGHFFRSLAICNALKNDDILFVSGGPQPAGDMPENVHNLALPALCMDENFSGLKPVDNSKSIDEIKKYRAEKLYLSFKNYEPDVFLVELFPFGRKAFRFELLPILKSIKNGGLPRARVVCSLRDILVERDDGGKHDKRCLKTLNEYFDMILIHSDPDIVKLEETYSLVPEIIPPLAYTGYVARLEEKMVQNETVSTIKEELRLKRNEKLIVASAGGGKVGGPILLSTVTAFARLNPDAGLVVFSGPYLDDYTYAELENIARANSAKILIKRFSTNFVSILNEADGLISMAGYNTTMDILSSGIPALVHPFSQNREQRMRIEKMSGKIQIETINDDELLPSKLIPKINTLLKAERSKTPSVNILGASASAKLIHKLIKS